MVSFGWSKKPLFFPETLYITFPVGKSTVPEANGSEQREKSVFDFFSPGGGLSRVLPQFELREGQREMALAVLDALMNNHTLVVEAGTGIGKTLAYLLPALLSGRRVIVSTATKNLQEQICEQDAPAIARALKAKLSVVHLKGRRNYLCLRRFFRFQAQGTFSFKEEAVLFRAIEKWATRTQTGDRAEIEKLPDEYRAWEEISSTPDTCLGSSCSFFDRCFVTRIRRRAQSADLVVVNHHLFFSDLGIREKGGAGILPHYEAVVMDEAHHVEETASSYFGVFVSSYRVDDLLRDLVRELTYEKIEAKDLLEIGSRTEGAARDFFTGISSRLTAGDSGKFRIREGFYTIDDRRRAEALKEWLFVLKSRILELGTEAESILSLAWRAGELSDDLDFIVTMPDREYVFWCEVRGRGVFLAATPIRVAQELERTLFRNIDTLIFTSATLAVAGDLDFFTSRIGLPRSPHGLILQSGYRMDEQALLYVPRNIPDPGNPAFVSAIGSMILDLLSHSRGRALLLFNSIKNMMDVSAIITDKLPVRVMVQGTAPRGVLLKNFREDVTSVLCATVAFREGIDVPGEALSLVVIDKLPFDPPTDPVIEARLEYLADEGKNPFMDYQLPRAVLLLKQGLGRLIRSKSDRGVIGILDPRLHRRRYGRVFFESLAEYPCTDDIDDVRGFFEA
jgi:ATP-dependent DNA helicase DinG